jgi:hypothetical protein
MAIKLICTAFTFTSLVILAVPNFALSANFPGSSSQFSTESANYFHTNLIAQRLSLGGLLAELESNIKWSAVDGKWRSRRDSWVSDVGDTRDPAILASLLVELESNIKWSAVQGKWRDRRDSWLRDCESVSSSRQLSQLLLELESNIKWSAVEGRWRDRRDSWVSDVQRSR